MPLDTDTLKQIKLIRAFTDPLVPHAPTADWMDSHNTGENQKAIQLKRLERIDEYPLDEPIPKATWTETTLFLSTLSMDENFVVGGAGKQTVTFMYNAFIGMLAERGFDNPREVIPSAHIGATQNKERLNKDTGHNYSDEDLLDVDDDGIPKLTDGMNDKLEQLRQELKIVQDAVFLDQVYDDLPFETDGVPKTFWKEATLRLNKTNDKQDDNQQTGLDMF